MNEIVPSDFEGLRISTRADGYWNATEMCQAYNKRLDNFLRLDSTQAYLKAFDKLRFKSLTSEESETGSQQELGKRESEESETDSQQELDHNLKSAISQTRGGRGKQGTWVHPQLALKLAAWLNPEFEVWVYATIEKLFTQGEVKLKDELAGLQSALNQATETIDEYDTELALSQYKQTQLKQEYLAAVCLSHWEGDYSDYSEDPDCYQSQKMETKQ